LLEERCGDPDAVQAISQEVKGEIEKCGLSLDGFRTFRAAWIGLAIKIFLMGEFETTLPEFGGLTALNMFVLAGNVQAVKYILLKKWDDLNLPSREGDTCLHLASRTGQEELVRIFLDSKASINALNMRKSTPLHSAARNGHLDVVGILLKAGADVEARDNRGRTPLNEASRNGHKEVVVALLWKSRRPGDDHAWMDSIACCSSKWS
jgi:hypothetical protein